MLAFRISELIRATFYAYIFQLLTDIETTLDLTAFYNIFLCGTHDGITFTRFYVKEIDAEIEFSVQTDTSSFLNVL